MAVTYNLGSDYVNIKASTSVNLKNSFVIHTPKGPIEFEATITSDFAEIPEKYHEICINILTSKYLNRADFESNPFSKCNRPTKKRRWYQFWKHKIFSSEKIKPI